MGYCFLRNITNTTNRRTLIAAVVPRAAFSDTLPLLFPTNLSQYKTIGSLIVANLNAFVLDFVARQKIQGTHASFYLLEQLPIIPVMQFENTYFDQRTAADIIRAAVLELTYTAHNLASFARDMGYVDETGEVRPPFP